VPPDDDPRAGPRRRATEGSAPDAVAGRRAAAARRDRLPADPGPGRVPRVRQRRRGGVDGRCDRRLVRGRRAVQAPAGDPGPAHGAGAEAQGDVRSRARGVRQRELPPGGRHPDPRPGGGARLQGRRLAGPRGERPPPRRGGLRAAADGVGADPRRGRRRPHQHRARAAVPGGADQPARRQPAPRDRRGRGARQLRRHADRRGAPLADRQRGHVLRRGRRAGAVVGAGGPQRARHPPAARRDRRVAGGHPPRAVPPLPSRARQAAQGAGRRAAARPRHHRPDGAVQGAVPRPPPGVGDLHLAVERAAPRDHRSAPGDRRRAREAGRGRGHHLRRAAPVRPGDAHPDRRAGRLPERLPHQPLRQRADLGHHPHDRPVGRQGGLAEDRAAGRQGPAVHPDQRHDRGWARRADHPRRRGAVL
ncbi:MAG: probable membrane protein STY4873, partial [uncultured Nocardioidaceae bacterium]